MEALILVCWNLGLVEKLNTQILTTKIHAKLITNTNSPKYQYTRNKFSIPTHKLDTLTSPKPPNTPNGTLLLKQQTNSQLTHLVSSNPKRITKLLSEETHLCSSMSLYISPILHDLLCQSHQTLNKSAINIKLQLLFLGKQGIYFKKTQSSQNKNLK